MHLLERYLQAVGQYLPEATKDDTLAELRENLLAQMEAREEELGRPLTEAETAAILKAHGKPEVVAVRYLPQQYLIGPTIFPFYLFTLRRTLPLVVLACAIAWAVPLIFGPVSGQALAASLGKAALGLVPTLLIFWGIMTAVFFLIERAHHTNKASPKWQEWDPAKLPALAPSMPGAKRKSLASRIADLVFHCLWMAYVLLIPYHPFLIIGPGVYYLKLSSWALAPVWHVFFIALTCLLTVQLVMKIAALFDGNRPWEAPLGWVVKVLGLGILVLMVVTSTYFVPASAATDLTSLAATNHWINVSFRIVLAINVVMLIVDAWKLGRRWIPAGKLAF